MNTEAKLGTGLVAFSLLLIYYLVPNYVVESRFVASDAMSAGLFPKVVGYFLGALGLFLVGAGVRERFGSGPKPTRSPIIRGPALLRVAGLFFIALGYYHLTLRAGYVLATFVVLPVVMWYFGCRDKKVVLVTAVVFPVLIYLLFARLMMVPLPQGKWF